jgi:hypothetical protein
MFVILVLYAVFFLLLGIGGLILFPRVARLCYERFLLYVASARTPVQAHELLVSCLVIVGWSLGVQFCFARAAALFGFVL